MPRTITETELRVFVASPGDVKDERDRLERVVSEMNARGGAAHHASVRLKLLRWETDVAPDAGRPQGVVFEQLPPEDWDIFVGILWLRFGSDTGEIDPVTKQPYRSGTDEEFKAAYRLRESRGDGLPKVMFYRCTRPPADLLRFDLTQFARVQQFFEGFLPGGQHPGLVQTYSAPEEFERMVRQHLGMWIADLATSPRATTPAAPSPAPTPRVPSDAERQAALTKYLKNLSRACNALPLAALDEDVSPHRRAEITLDRVYVALDTTKRVSLTDDEKREREKRPVLRRDEDRLLAVYQAAAQNARLVITGDPGSGKSSFVNNLAVLLISARLSRADLPAPWTHGALLPVRVLLRELAPTLPDEKQLQRLSADQRAHKLSDAVREFIGKLPATFDAPDAAPLVLAALDDGECLVIFDGLDEVAPERRKIAREAVEAFAHRYPDNRFLVTCRVRSYQDHARLPSFDEVTLAKLDNDKINAFVDAWYHVLAGLDRIPREQEKSRADDLRQAVARLQELAETPLLLTTMAIVHAAQVKLPRERARLYERCVEILLLRWHKHKVGESPLLDELGLSESELLKALWHVAYEAHKRGKPGEATDLPKKEVLAILAQRMGKYGKAERFLEYVEDRAGLLVAHGGVDEAEPVYSFPHRTFQEFLAGCYLALGIPADFASQLRALLREDDRWILVARLGAEHLLYNANDVWKVLHALYWLCPVIAEPRDAADWRGLVLAGNIAVEMGAERIRREDPDNPEGGDAFLKRLIPRLVALIERGLLSPLERAEAGVALAKLGDPRPGVGIITLPLRAGDYSPYASG